MCVFGEWGGGGSLGESSGGRWSPRNLSGRGGGSYDRASTPPPHTHPGPPRPVLRVCHKNPLLRGGGSRKRDSNAPPPPRQMSTRSSPALGHPHLLPILPPLFQCPEHLPRVDALLFRCRGPIERGRRVHPQIGPQAAAGALCGGVRGLHERYGPAAFRGGAAPTPATATNRQKARHLKSTACAQISALGNGVANAKPRSDQH